MTGGRAAGGGGVMHVTGNTGQPATALTRCGRTRVCHLSSEIRQASPSPTLCPDTLIKILTDDSERAAPKSLWPTFMHTEFKAAPGEC